MLSRTSPAPQAAPGNRLLTDDTSGDAHDAEGNVARRTAAATGATRSLARAGPDRPIGVINKIG
jgi:hypothetical protein